MNTQLVRVPYVLQGNGIVFANLSFANGSMDVIADFFQKLIYFTTLKYLTQKIQKELNSESVRKRAQSHFFTIELHKKSLIVFNSGISDDAFFDKNDLSFLIEDLKPHMISGKPRTYWLFSLGLCFTVKPEKDDAFLFCFHHDDEDKTLNPMVQSVLKEVLDTMSC